MTKTSCGEGRASTSQPESKSTQEDQAQGQGRIRVVIASERWIMAEGIRHALSAPTIEVAAVCLDPTTALEFHFQLRPQRPSRWRRWAH